MSGFATKSVVQQTHEVGRDERDASGAITVEALRGWILAATGEYLDRCAVFNAHRDAAGRTLRTEIRPDPAPVSLGGADAVFVTASATEVWPDAFAIGVRVRVLAADDAAPVIASVIVALVDDAGERLDLGTDVRDELIALEHSAGVAS